jgi:hypothetical protein
MARAGERYQESRDIWDDYNDRQKFEHELINRKTTWWLTTQTILFAAYGVTFDKQPVGDAAVFRRLIAWVGLLVAVVTLLGVLAVMRSKRRSWLLYKDFYRKSAWCSLPRPLDDRPLEWGVLTTNTRWTLVF